jgi:hypothetical protein
VDLPNDSIGISDILQFRECRRRWAFDMQRWSDQGEAPEATNPNNVYGSAIHLAIAATEEGASDDEAIEAAVERYGGWLDAEDFEALAEDLSTYHERDYAGVKTVASEDNLRVPLFEHEGRMIYFRFTLDRLYQRIDQPGAFIHVDYKSSGHRKTEEEVHSDPQLWAYNFAIHEYWPEVTDLYQLYDQLRFGTVPTRKNDDQRRQIKEWLIAQVKVILRAEHLQPKFNKWCPWCPIMESCSEPKRVSEFAQARIEALAPEGADVEGLASADLETYVEDLDTFETVRKCIQRYEESVKGVIRELPDERRRELGFRLQPASKDVWTPQALKRVHGQVGDDFYLLVNVTKANIQRFYGKDKEAQQAVLAHATKESQNPRLKRL